MRALFLFSILFLSLFALLRAEEFSFTLQEAERLALANNNELNAIRQAVCEGNWDYLAAVSDWYPHVNWTAFGAWSQKGFLLTRLTSGVLNRNSRQRTFYSNGGTLTQPLFNPDLYFGLRVGKLELQQLQLGLQAAINDLVYAVRAAYYLVLVDESQVVTNREHINLLAQAMREEVRRFEVGQSTSFQVDETKVAVANALPLYYNALRRLKQDRDSLVQLLGMNPDCAPCIELSQREIPLMTVPLLSEKLNLEGRPDCMGCCALPPPEFFERIEAGETPGEEWQSACDHKLFTQKEILEWEALALCYRPDVLLEQKKLQTSMAEIKQRWGDFLPSANFVTQYAAPGTSRLSPGTPLNEPFKPHYNLGVFVNAEWEIFSGFSRVRRVRAAKAAWRSSVYRYQKSIQDAKVAVRATFYEMEEAFNTYISAHQSVGLAESAIEEAQRRRDVGVITSLDYREVVDNLLQARTQENYARYHLLRSYYQLLQVVGLESVISGVDCCGSCCN